MTNPDSFDPVFDYLAATSLDQFNLAQFAKRLNEFTPDTNPIHPLSQPGAEFALPPTKDGFQKQLEKRRSTRTFGQKPLSIKQVSAIFASCGSSSSGHRLLPSAGDLHSVHLYGMLRQIEGPLNSRVVRYVADNHALGDIKPIPSDDELRRLFNIPSDDELPQLLVLFVGHLGPAQAKYGARGSRFVLQELGHGAQNVSLRLAASNLAGYLLGGTMDQDVFAAIGLNDIDGVVFGATMACGTRP